MALSVIVLSCCGYNYTFKQRMFRHVYQYYFLEMNDQVIALFVIAKGSWTSFAIITFYNQSVLFEMFFKRFTKIVDGVECGVIHVYDILNENGELLSHNEITRKFNTRCHFLNMLQLRQSMPLEWRRSIQNSVTSNKVTSPFVYDGGYKLHLLSKLTTKCVYEMFCHKKCITATCIH